MAICYLAIKVAILWMALSISLAHSIFHMYYQHSLHSARDPASIVLLAPVMIVSIMDVATAIKFATEGKFPVPA